MFCLDWIAKKDGICCFSYQALPRGCRTARRLRLVCSGDHGLGPQLLGPRGHPNDVSVVVLLTVYPSFQWQGIHMGDSRIPTRHAILGRTTPNCSKNEERKIMMAETLSDKEVERGRRVVDRKSCSMALQTLLLPRTEHGHARWDLLIWSLCCGVFLGGI